MINNHSDFTSLSVSESDFDSNRSDERNVKKRNKRYKLKRKQSDRGPSSKELGKIELPKFDGEPSNFQQWWSEFKFLVHRNHNVKPAFKFIHLRRCLTNNAQPYIQELTPSKSNYEKVIKRLRSHFENISTQRESVNKKLSSLAKVTDDQDKDKLRSLLTEVQVLYRRARELRFSTDYINGELLTAIKQLFPFSIQLNANTKRNKPMMRNHTQHP